MNVNCQLDVLDGLHHGFLNFIRNSKDCLNASKFVTSTIKTAMDANHKQNAWVNTSFKK